MPREAGRYFVADAQHAVGAANGANGFAFASLNHTLCPTATLDTIIGQIRRATALLFDNAGSLASQSLLPRSGRVRW